MSDEAWKPRSEGGLGRPVKGRENASGAEGWRLWKCRLSRVRSVVVTKRNETKRNETARRGGLASVRFENYVTDGH